MPLPCTEEDKRHIKHCLRRDDLVELGDEGAEERDGDEEYEDAEDLPSSGAACV